MRKDMILGMSIGGIVLAIVVVYLTISPSHKTKSVVQLDTGNGEVQGSADTDPITASDRGSDSGPSLPRPTAHTGTGTEATGTVDVAPTPPAGGTTEGDRHDPVWGKRLYAPLMGVAQTPGSSEQTSGGDQRETVAPQRETLAMAERIHPAPGEISTGTLDSGSGNAAAAPATRPAGNTIAGTNHTGMTQHRVQPGESFSSIALAAYGSASYFPHILRANPGLDPRKLRPNMMINLPSASQVKPAEVPVTESPTLAAVAPGAPARVPTTPKPAAGAAFDPKSEYRVGSGDSLHRIAIKLYGKISMVQPLYEANKATIGPDMAKLKLGMVLKLPAAPSTAK